MNKATALILAAAIALSAGVALAQGPAGFPPNGTPAVEFLVGLEELATTTDQVLVIAADADAGGLCVDTPVFDAFEHAFVAMRSQLGITASALANGHPCSPELPQGSGAKILAYDPACNTNSSIVISASINLAKVDLECFGTLFVHVTPGSDVTIDLPLYNPLNGCTPAVIVTADNLATFTVRGPGGNDILFRFTTRGGAYRNAATNAWTRFL